MISSTVPERQQQQEEEEEEEDAPTNNHPCGEQFQGDRRKQYMETCVPLYTASVNGDWAEAEVHLNGNLSLVRSSITENQDTPLHIAATAPSIKFAENLLKKMNSADLKLRNRDGNTALCLAAIAGNVDMVEIMIENNQEELLTVRGSKNMMPIHLAALYGKHGMVKHLYVKVRLMSRDVWTEDDRNMLFLKCIEVDLFDVALEIFNDNKGIEFPQNNYVWEVLDALARKPYAFDDMEPNIIWKSINLIFEVFHLKLGPIIKKNEATQLLRVFWKKVMVNPMNNIDVILKGPMTDKTGVETYPSRIPFVATEMGNISFLVVLICQYPDLIWKRDDNGQSIFHVAVSHRRESIYRLLYEIGSMKDFITPVVDKDRNNMLHLVGMKAEKNPYENLLTAPFQMQRELLWFKEVKGMIPPSYREAKNTAGQTPSELFSENHKDLVSKSKKWMKGTTNQCIVAAVLIATIGFSGAFTIPGGYDQYNGFPQFLHDGHLIAFVVFDAISFILSSISILMFLSIVVSRYAQTDFLESLPQKLTIAVATLFLSIVTMMVAFGVSFFILYNNKFMVVPLLIGAFATIASIFYCKMQYPLLVDVFHSRYGSKYLFKAEKNILYYQNPTL